MTQKRVNVYIDQSLHEKGKKASKEMFGKIDFSMFVSTLIKNHKPKKK